MIQRYRLSLSRCTMVPEEGGGWVCTDDHFEEMKRVKDALRMARK